jgi:hypothetical protein
MTLAMTRTSIERTLLVGFPGHATSVGYRVQENLDYDTYQKILDNLLAMNLGGGWWLGDLLNQFEADYGARYTAALPDRRENASLYQMCADAKWLASKFTFSFRNEKLSLTHHRALVTLDLDERTLWLDRAVKNGWSVRGLREALQIARKTVLDQDAPDLIPQLGHGGSDMQIPSLRRADNPDAEDMVNDFLGGVGDEDDPGREDQAEADAPTLPGGSLYIPADAALLVQVLAALSEEACTTGQIRPPFLVNGWPFCPIRMSQEDYDNSLEVLAIRLMPLERYAEENYQARYPLFTADAWQQEVAEGRRVPTDFAGLCVKVDPTGEKWVLLHQRATFRGKRPRAGEQEQRTFVTDAAETDRIAEAVITKTIPGETLPPQYGPTVEAVVTCTCFCTALSEEHRRKLETLVETWQKRYPESGFTAATLVGYLIDAAFEGNRPEEAIDAEGDGDGG